MLKEILAAIVALYVLTYLVIRLLARKSCWVFTREECTYKATDDESKEYTLPEGHPYFSNNDEDIFLSIVVPCYNETARLEGMIKELVEYLHKQNDDIRLRTQYEIIIVDDGSSDGTSSFALELSRMHGLPAKRMKVFTLAQNVGKGGAVTRGMQCASGQYVIFADADGASRFSDVKLLLNEVKKIDKGEPLKNPAIAIGSRAHMVNTDAVVKRSLIRNILMYGLHTLVYIFGIRDIQDTQCGFKLFNRSAMLQVFPNMHAEGWIFDVELLIIAKRQNIPIAEIPVNWHEVDGSKMALATDSIKMAIDLVVIRMAYVLGIYRETSLAELEQKRK